MRNNKLSLLMFLVVITTILAACSKKWNEHDQITDPAISNNLFQAISKNTSLSLFSKLLVKSGYDKIISSSKSYTVWVPTNQALATLDSSIINDSIKLKAFVGNHIANLAYTTGSDQRVAMINGKYIQFAGNTFDSANISTPNLYAVNGVYHIIDKFIPRVDNCWEFVNNNSSFSLFKKALTDLNYIYFDSTLATQIGTDQLTGNAIWDSTNAKVIRNKFLDNVQNIADESNQFTLFLLNDNSFNTEFNKLSPWFITPSIDTMNKLVNSFLIKDLAVKGSYSASQLPDTLLSTSNVKIPIDKSQIVASYKTSNGYVHVMNKLNIRLTDKFPPIVIEGETPTAFASTDKAANTFYRTSRNPVTGLVFKDILMQNYGWANYYIRYTKTEVPAMKYNVYWVAINDYSSNPIWNQTFAIDSNYVPSPAAFTVPVARNNYNEVFLGQIEILSYRSKINMYVIGPNSTSTTSGNTSISLDYIKLVPAF